jgi:hypothetical protein
MNREQFIKYASGVSLLDSKSLEDIRNLLDEFPHFQSAWILYAKNLHSLRDVRFESKLKVAAVYVPDRRVLSRIINGTYIPGEINNETEPVRQLSDHVLLPETEDLLVVPETLEEAPIVFVPQEETITDEQEIIVVETPQISSAEVEPEPIIIAEPEQLVEDTKVEIIDVVEPISETIVSEVDTITAENETISENETADNPEFTSVSAEQIHTETSSEEIPDDIPVSFSSSASERVLQNIDDIKSNNYDAVVENNTAETDEEKLRQIINQRLKELGINEPAKTISVPIVEEIIEVKPATITETAEIIEISEIYTPVKPSEPIDFESINESELLDFAFDGDLNDEIGKVLPEKSAISKDFIPITEQISEKNKPKKAELIDKFLASNPRIVPDREYISNSTAAMSSLLSDDDGLFSETLAKIYINQGHYDKAILTYEKLCLKYPEKNIYFAGQIEKIKELIKNKKN